jgi:hypothetical protein
MRYISIFQIVIISILFIPGKVSGQQADSVAMKVYSRFSFYTTETNGEFLLHLPPALMEKNLKVIVTAGKDTLSNWSGSSGKKILRVTFPIQLKTGRYSILASAKAADNTGKKYFARTKLTMLTYKPNEVKTDRLTGGLIVNKLPFFPFGFYTYSPVDPAMPGEEITKGFNMISPYQKIMPESLADRKAYMDRCAQIGMKVHYNLLSVSGGGGVGSRIAGLSAKERRKRLIDEITMFRDHPALLGWYIADEPNGYKIAPAILEEIYNTIRECDPWHPVSIVFMAPFLSSRRYENSLDIVMADPYPLPDLPVTLVGDVAGQLHEQFEGKRPVWMVPQAFGGGELWKREPTYQEIRSMTWQSIINGATGIQYFVRQGPNYFPKSANTWSECGRVAMEVAELTPWLLSDEDPLPAESSSKNILVSSRIHDGKLVVIAINKINEPVNASIRIQGVADKKARSIFENRMVNVNNGTLNDYLPPFGTHAYLIDTAISDVKDSAPDPNLVLDPGFEDLSSPGVPSACYARPGGDDGATFFLDSREHVEGTHSLRLVTPEKDKPVTIRFYPFKVKSGSSYIISLWAKSDPEQRFGTSEQQPNERFQVADPQYIEVQLGNYSYSWFVPGKEWKQYVTFVTIPGKRSSRANTNLVIRMPGQGVAWIDQVRVIEEK